MANWENPVTMEALLGHMLNISRLSWVSQDMGSPKQQTDFTWALDRHKLVQQIRCASRIAIFMGTLMASLWYLNIAIENDPLIVDLASGYFTQPWKMDHRKKALKPLLKGILQPAMFDDTRGYLTYLFKDGGLSGVSEPMPSPMSSAAQVSVI